MKCAICNGDFHDSPDGIVLCKHKGKAVHLGCCVYNCSLNKSPCKHALSVYEKI